MKRGKTWHNFKHSFKANPKMTLLYLILRVIVVAIMVAQFFNGDIANVFLCLLTLLLFMIPSFVEKRIKISIPNTMEVFVIIFIFAAEILGEIAEYYVNVRGVGHGAAHCDRLSGCRCGVCADRYIESLDPVRFPHVTDLRCACGVLLFHDHRCGVGVF